MEKPSPMIAEWRVWSEKNKPQNEDAFFRCFCDAWGMAVDATVPDLERDLNVMQAKNKRLEDEVRFLDEVLNGRMIVK